jgi:hypothetical protein
VTKTGSDNFGFTSLMAGGTITINWTDYMVASFTDAAHITLSTSAGNQQNAKWSFNGPDPDWWTTDIWRNNVIYSASAGAPLISAGTINQSLGYCEPGRSTTDHDTAWFNANVGSAVGTLPSGNLFNNPLFTAASRTMYASPGAFFLKLQTTSPAIAAGRTASQPAKDIRGVARSSPDAIGAYSAR